MRVTGSPKVIACTPPSGDAGAKRARVRTIARPRSSFISAKRTTSRWGYASGPTADRTKTADEASPSNNGFVAPVEGVTYSAADRSSASSSSPAPSKSARCRSTKPRRQVGSYCHATDDSVDTIAVVEALGAEDDTEARPA